MYWSATNAGRDPFKGAYGRQIRDRASSWSGFQAGVDHGGLAMAEGTANAAIMVMSGGLGAGEVGGDFSINGVGRRANFLEGLTAKGRTNLVYQGLDAAGTVRYVGITEREAAVRFGEHLNSGTAKSLLDFRAIDEATGLTRTQARVWEQTLINQYGLGKNGGQLLKK